MGESWLLLSVQFADHGGLLTSAIRTRHPVDPPTPSVTWQSREHRETRWTHGFASPPYDGFAGSGMKNPVEHRTAASIRDHSDRCGHLQFYTANLGRDFRAVKSDHDFLSDDSCSGMSNAGFSLTGTAAARVHHTVLTFETPLEFPKIPTITYCGASDFSGSSRPRSRKPGGAGGEPDSFRGTFARRRPDLHIGILPRPGRRSRSEV